jgi:RNA polymerase sigma-70 factor, ECF subfamily
MAPPSPTTTDHQITELLRRARDDRAAQDRLYRLVEVRLHGMAQSLLRGQRPGHTLQPSDLIGQAFVDLVRERRQGWAGRTEFFGLARNRMRQILCDHGRRRRPVRVTPEEQAARPDPRSAVPGARLEWLEEQAQLLLALERLQAEDPLGAQVVAWRYFGKCPPSFAGAGAQVPEVSPGKLLTFEQIAHILGRPRATVADHGKRAILWLKKELSDSRPGGTHARRASF